MAILFTDKHLVAEKYGKVVKIELKAIDMQGITGGKPATQHITANEIINASHVVISIFQGSRIENSYVMTMQQFVENSGVKKYSKFKSYDDFLSSYRQSVETSLNKRKGSEKGEKKNRTDFDFSFKLQKIGTWKLYKFKEKWEYLENQ